MMMSKMMGQAENARHVATADLGGGLTDFAIELRCFFDNEYRASGRRRFSTSAVAAPENAPPTIATS